MAEHLTALSRMMGRNGATKKEKTGRRQSERNAREAKQGKHVG